MISTEILYGQGLGNQLACYVTTRAIARTKGLDFGIHDPHGCWGDKRYNDKGLYFLDLDMGQKVDQSKIEYYYNESEERYFNNSCPHDIAHGAWVNRTDQKLLDIKDNTHILGIMQGPDQRLTKAANCFDRQHFLLNPMQMKEVFITTIEGTV